MTLRCFRQLADVLRHGSAVLATVVQSKGSVPREVGAKMIIGADGRTFDTIGGGAGEAKVIRHAMTVLETGEKQWVELDLSGAPQRETQGICGGTMQVWLERWDGAGAIALVHQILNTLRSGQPATLVTPFDTGHSPYLADPMALPTPTHAFVETLQPAPTLLIVGAGHVGEQLAKVAHRIGFEIVIQDDRPEWANPQRYPQAAQIFVEPVAATMVQLATHTQLYAALVTRSYQYDLEALESLLKRAVPCQYIGMIGSEKRVCQVYQAIAKTGIPGSTLESIYAPIGLDIGALTPEEIAVSISAELILARRGGTGRPLSGQWKCGYPT
ncbi:MAG: XdhC family protein [Leptolyngbyaceae cyanobacterium RU_5_1]|nr:XdhC family protein [Leptolyngbyaceae cyanobacterium RU_5_1]